MLHAIVDCSDGRQMYTFYNGMGVGVEGATDNERNGKRSETVTETSAGCSTRQLRYTT